MTSSADLANAILFASSSFESLLISGEEDEQFFKEHPIELFHDHEFYIDFLKHLHECAKKVLKNIQKAKNDIERKTFGEQCLVKLPGEFAEWKECLKQKILQAEKIDERGALNAHTFHMLKIKKKATLQLRSVQASLDKKTEQLKKINDKLAQYATLDDTLVEVNPRYEQDLWEHCTSQMEAIEKKNGQIIMRRADKMKKEYQAKVLTRKITLLEDEVEGRARNLAAINTIIERNLEEISHLHKQCKSNF